MVVIFWPLAVNSAMGSAHLLTGSDLKVCKTGYTYT